MQQYLVTIKLPRNPEHDPQRKQVGKCPLDNNRTCNDVTGQHHTLLVLAAGIRQVRSYYEDEGYHITRIEKVHTVTVIHESQTDRRADSA